jgi:hypothetical protein
MSVFVELPEKDYVADAFEAFAAAGGFTLGNGRAMAWMSQLAYESDLAKIDRRLAAWGLHRLARLDAPFSVNLPVASTHGIVAAGRGATVVAFAGTDPVLVANMITNLNARRSPQDVHSGFENAGEAIWPQVNAAVGAGMSVLITGHSLGAALAAITAERMQRETPARTVSVYAFGMPRVGGREFAERYNAILCQRTYRLVYGHDAVPAVPPAGFQFQHVGRQLACGHGQRFDAANLLADCASNAPETAPTLVQGFRAGLLDRLSGAMEARGRNDWLGLLYTRMLPQPLRDHLPDRYWGAFEDAV